VIVKNVIFYMKILTIFQRSYHIVKK